MNDQRDDLTTEDIAKRAPEQEAPSQDRTDSDEIDDRGESDAMSQGSDEQPTEADTATRQDDAGEASMPLFSAEDSERFRSRWTDIQAGFVDQPREMVEQADHLVADLMQRLAAQFSEERGRLEAQWDSNDDVSTEDLRITLTRYRSFFERLLSA